ncbi:MAG: F0F1 ATP synthase subunit delta [Treponema sp.]|jgi:F0F1-type ATP synthase delta subunit|nr:F0F1 ATP synthase subunit delta [Treponema sp.]
MFAAERWAAAFVNVAGKDQKILEEGVKALKALIPCMEKIPGALAGKVSADQLERMIRRSMEKVSPVGEGTEYACRLLALLVKKGLFTRHTGRALLEEIEKIWNRNNGILVVKVDSAVPLDEELRKTLQETIRRKLGAKEIALIPRIVPELLGGYRLYIGSVSVDASLCFLLQNMAADLQKVPRRTWAAGGVAW